METIRNECHHVKATFRTQAIPSRGLGAPPCFRQSHSLGGDCRLTASAGRADSGANGTCQSAAGSSLAGLLLRALPVANSSRTFAQGVALALFPALSDTGNDFVLAKAEQYLASRASAIVHGFSAQNMELAGICKQEAEDNLEQILQIYIHRNQAAPVRRKGYSPPYRY